MLSFKVHEGPRGGSTLQLRLPFPWGRSGAQIRHGIPASERASSAAPLLCLPQVPGRTLGSRAPVGGPTLHPQMAGTPLPGLHPGLGRIKLAINSADLNLQDGSSPARPASCPLVSERSGSVHPTPGHSSLTWLPFSQGGSCWAGQSDRARPRDRRLPSRQAVPTPGTHLILIWGLCCPGRPRTRAQVILLRQPPE